MSNQNKQSKAPVALYAPFVGGEALTRPLAVIGLTGLKVDSIIAAEYKDQMLISYKTLVKPEDQRPPIVILLQTPDVATLADARNKRYYLHR